MADEPRSPIPTLPEKDPDEILPLPIRDKKPEDSLADPADVDTGTSMPPDGTQVIPPSGKPGPKPKGFKPPQPPRPIV